MLNTLDTKDIKASELNKGYVYKAIVNSVDDKHEMHFVVLDVKDDVIDVFNLSDTPMHYSELMECIPYMLENYGTDDYANAAYFEDNLFPVSHIDIDMLDESIIFYYMKGEDIKTVLGFDVVVTQEVGKFEQMIFMQL